MKQSFMRNPAGGERRSGVKRKPVGFSGRATGEMMLPACLSYVMIYVTDMDRSVKFYRDVLGLPLRFQSPGWSEFNTEGTTIALHLAAGQALERKGPTAGTVDIGWTVEDINGVCSELRDRGVRFTMDPTPTEGGSMLLAIFPDPDGCPLTLAQLAGR